MQARTRSPRLLLYILTGLVVACSASCRRRPTYHQDVAPILAARCVGCHREGGVAPTPRLGTYDEAVAAGAKIALAVRTREMPPWGADNSGQCRTWRGASWLANADVRTLVEWSEGSKAEGDGSHAPAVISPTVPKFGPVGAVAAMTSDYTPGLGPMAYRCFVVDPDLATDQAVAAVRVVSTEPRSVQQVTLYALDSQEDELAASRLDQDDPAIGYGCYGSSRIANARLVMSWTWDSPIMRMPAGYAVRVHGRHRLVMQVHYNVIATGLGVPTRTRLEMELAPDAKEARYLAVAPAQLNLAPGQIRAEAIAEVPLPNAVTVLGVAPRMHSLGKTMQLDLEHGAHRDCVANFDHWNFYRQRLFEYESPLRIEAGDTVRISCVYNTQSRTQPTTMGETIEDEECLASLLVTP